jgi:hypothetical protein
MIGRHNNAQRIALRLQIVVMLEIIHDEWLIARDHVIEACIQLDEACLKPEKYRCNQADQQDSRPVIEQQALKQRAGLTVKIRYVGYNG